MAIHAAPLDSPRLQIVLSVLRANRERWLSRRELRELCGPAIEDPTVVIRELRANNIKVDCEKKGRHYCYRLAREGQLGLFGGAA